MRAGILIAVLVYVAVALQVTLVSAAPFAVSIGSGAIAPSLPLIVAIFAGLLSRRHGALAVFIAVGLLTDVTSNWPLEGDGSLVLVGPYTLGYIAAWYTLGQVRQVLVRHHPLAAVFAVLVCGAAVHLIVLAVMTTRGWYEPVAGFSAVGELLRRGLGLGYTAAIAGVIAVLLPMKRMAGGQGRMARWATH